VYRECLIEISCVLFCMCFISGVDTLVNTLKAHYTDDKLGKSNGIKKMKLKWYKNVLSLIVVVK